MDRVFSVEEIANPFWPPAMEMDDSNKLMNRSSSEWSFQRFLQDVDPLPLPPVISNPPSLTSSSSSSSQPQPSDENREAFLKRKLDLACAAVAFTRASLVKPQDSAPLADNRSHVSDAVPLGPYAPEKGSGISFLNEPDKVVVAPLATPALPVMQKVLVSQNRPATSTSSREQSDDEDIEDETEITDSMDPADVKRVRRKLSNRESARRSRRRKQAHMSELETQVAQLRVEKSSLLKRFSDVSQKYSGAAVDNRVLKADLEALRTKVKMAEDSVKRAAGLNPMFQGMCEIPNMCMPFNGNTSADAAVPVQENSNQHFYQHASNNLQNNRVINNDLINNIPLIPPIEEEAHESGRGNKMGRTPSMHQIANLEHSQKRIRGGTTPGPVHWDPVWDQEAPPALDGSNRQNHV